MKSSKLLQSIVWISMVYYGGVLSSCSNSNKEVLNTSGKLPDKIDFNFHVKPVLSDRCFACHGPDANAREADLRLYQEEAAYAALKRSEEHTSELQSLMRISYAVFCLKKKNAK